MLHCWSTWNFEGMNVNNFFVEFRPTKHSAVKFERHKGKNTAAPLLPYSNVSRIMKKKNSYNTRQNDRYNRNCQMPPDLPLALGFSSAPPFCGGTFLVRGPILGTHVTGLPGFGLAVTSCFSVVCSQGRFGCQGFDFTKYFTILNVHSFQPLS